jgi:uncharacterized protein (DUF1800 family)
MDRFLTEGIAMRHLVFHRDGRIGHWFLLLAATTLVSLPQWLFAATPNPPTLEGPKGPVWNEDAARHLLSRATFGGTPEEARRLAAMHLEKAVDSLLDEAAAASPPERPEWVRDVWINEGRQWSDMSHDENRIVHLRDITRNQTELNDLRAWWLEQMISTKAPLRENLTLFWHGHFTSATSKVANFAQAFYQQNETFRRCALGNFREFLKAVTLDPAMMAYLDTERSNKAHPSENYARELLELFTLGVGSYTEKDVQEIARALTGWTLDAPPGSVKVNRPTLPEYLQIASITRDGMVPTFVAAQHDDGDKTVFGKTGRFGVDEVLDLIVRQPACGRYVAGQLIAYFGANDPQGRLRERMAATFRDSHYEIRPVLKVLLTSPEFYDPAIRGAKIKGPVRLLVGACRGLRLIGAATPSLAQLTAASGQELFNPPSVKGWPAGNAWISASTLPWRYRLGEALVAGETPAEPPPLGRLRVVPVSRDPAHGAAAIMRLLAFDRERREQKAEGGLKVHFSAGELFPQGPPESPDRLADALLKPLIVTKVRATTREAIVEACQSVPPGERVAVAARLILASPEYQME